MYAHTTHTHMDYRMLPDMSTCTDTLISTIVRYQGSNFQIYVIISLNI